MEPRLHQLQHGRVIYVYDGDTIFIDTGNVGTKVRLASINTPERGHLKYKDAKQFTIEAVLGRWIGLENHRQQWDMHGRRIASVWYGENFALNLSDELRRAGLGVEEPTRAPNPNFLVRSYHPRGILTGDSAVDLLSAIARDDMNQ